MLEDIGYGKNGRKADVETIGDFLCRIPEYLEVLESYKPQDNRVILATLAIGPEKMEQKSLLTLVESAIVRLL